MPILSSNSERRGNEIVHFDILNCRRMQSSERGFSVFYVFVTFMFADSEWNWFPRKHRYSNRIRRSQVLKLSSYSQPFRLHVHESRQKYRRAVTSVAMFNKLLWDSDVTTAIYGVKKFAFWEKRCESIIIYCNLFWFTFFIFGSNETSK